MKTFAKLAVFCVACACLGLVNLYLSNDPVDATPITNGAPSAGQLGGGEENTAGSGTGHIEELTFVQTFSRPLFSQDRRKYQPPAPKPKPEPKKVVAAEPAPEPVIDPPDFRLVGVSISGQAARALVVSSSSPDPRWVAEGETIGRWTLVRIADDSISVAQSGKEVVLELYPKDRSR